MEISSDSSEELTNIIEARQFVHIKNLDCAYYEGYTVMREAAGQDLRTPNMLADSYGPYMAWRRELLKRKLLDTHAHHDNTGCYPTRNRFGLDATAGLEDPVAASVPVASVSATPNASYASWRRALLSRRFEARNASLQDDIVKRMAAEAMQRALAAEDAERSVDEPHTGHGHVPLAPPEPRVWRVRCHLPVFPDDTVMPLEAPGWQPKKKAELRVPSFKEKVITAVAFAPNDPDFVAIGSDSGEIHICCISSNSRWTTLNGHTSAVTSIEWMPSYTENMLVSCSTDKTVRAWQVLFPRRLAPRSAPPLTPASTLKGTRTTAVLGSGGMSSPTTKREISSSPPPNSPGTPRKRAFDRSSELERAKREIEMDAEKAKFEAERQRGITLEGGSAYCVKVVTTDFSLSHIITWPGSNGLVLCAAVEDADVDAEAALEAAEALRSEPSSDSFGHGTATPSSAPIDRSHGSAAFSPVSKMGNKVGGMFVKGIKGGLKGSAAAVRAVGDVTMGAIESVPVVGNVVGGAVGKTVSIMRAGVGVALGVGRREKRGHLLVVDVMAGRVVQARKVAGTRTATLANVHSYITGLTFSSTCQYIFVADARGLVHLFTAETEIAKQHIRPLRDHFVVFGESTRFTPFVGTRKFGGEHLDDPTVYLSSLQYKQHDPVAKGPVLLGVDNSNHVRTLKLAADLRSTTTFSNAVGAMNAVASGSFNVTNSPLVAQEIAWIHYTSGLPVLSPTPSSESSVGSEFSDASSTLGPAAGGTHTVAFPCKTNDGVFCGTTAGEIFLLDPSADSADAAAGKHTKGGFGLLPAGTSVGVGAGVSATQIVAKLLGHVRPVNNLMLNEPETILLSCDSTSQLVVWEKVALSAAERSGGVTGYVHDSARSYATIGAGASAKIQERLFEQINQSSVGRAGLVAGGSIGRVPALPSPLRAASGDAAAFLPKSTQATQTTRALPAGWMAGK